jgi:MFS family permease
MRSPGLWRHPEFLKLWASSSVSLLGAQVSLLALPLTAALTLEAGPAEMGALRAAEFAPALLLGLLAGVWVDRLPHRPLMVGADMARALLLLAIPATAATGTLRIEHLLIVAFLIGGFSVLFDVAYTSFLPALLPRHRLVEANGKLQLSGALSQLVGPALAGPLVQVVGAPMALVTNSASWLIAGSLLVLVRAPHVPPGGGQTAGIRAEIAEGLRLVLGHPVLRAIAAGWTTFLLFGNALVAGYVLYLTRDLSITPLELGQLSALGGVGSLAGAALAPWAARRLGIGRALTLAMLVAGAGGPLVPLAGALVPAWRFPVLAVSSMLSWCGVLVYTVNEVSLRQAVTPARLQGRVNATFRVATWGAIPLGSLAGGFLAEVLGLQGALLLSGVGMMLAFPCVLFSPIRGIGRMDSTGQPIVPLAPDQAVTA